MRECLKKGTVSEKQQKCLRRACSAANSARDYQYIKGHSISINIHSDTLVVLLLMSVVLIAYRLPIDCLLLYPWERT